MAVRLLRAVPFLVDGNAVTDFEDISPGVLVSLPQITGNAGCVLHVATPAPRIP